MPRGSGSDRSIASEPAVKVTAATLPPRRSATVRSVPPAKSSRQLTAWLSVTVTGVVPLLADSTATSFCPERSRPSPQLNVTCEGAPAGVLARSSVPLVPPRLAVRTFSRGVPVTTSRVALDRPPAARLTVCDGELDGTPTASAVPAAATTSTAAPATTSVRRPTGITCLTITTRDGHR